MHFRLPALPTISCLQRLRDPQVQVWVMAGVSVLLVLIGHIRAWNPSGEGKNNYRESASRLLLAGASLSWSDGFGSAPRQERRPVIQLNAPSFPVRSTSAKVPPALNLRPAMQTAASQPWQAVDRSIRQKLSSETMPGRSLQVRLSWSGDTRGNAALVERRLPAGGANEAAVFVIGNGSRSGDGRIECLSSGASFASGRVDITLIGQTGRISPRQLAAVAELLVHLEALSGYPIETAPGGGSTKADLSL